MGGEERVTSHTILGPGIVMIRVTLAPIYVYG